MRVKMLTTMAGPLGVSMPGTVCTFDDAEGQRLVDGGYAELVETSEAKAPGEPVTGEPGKPAKKGKGKKTPKEPSDATGDENTSDDETDDDAPATDTGDTPA